MSLSKAIQHEQNENLIITSKIHVVCSKPSSTNIQWTILSCLSTCTKQIQVNSSIQTSQDSLSIPAKSLSSGFYQIQLTVAMTVDPSLSASSFTYIEIIRSTIFTKLNPSTSLTITHNVDDDLTINPGEFSFDLYRVLWNKEVWKNFHSFTILLKRFRNGYIFIIVEWIWLMIKRGNYLTMLIKLVFEIHHHRL